MIANISLVLPSVLLRLLSHRNLLIANLRLFFRGQSTLPWTYTTGAGSAAKDILDLDRETVLEIIGPGVIRVRRTTSHTLLCSSTPVDNKPALMGFVPVT